MPGRQRVTRAETGRRNERQHEDERRQIGLPEDVRDVGRGDPTRDGSRRCDGARRARAPRRRGRQGRRRHRRPDDRCRVRHIECREHRAASGRGSRGAASAKRRGDPLLGVAGEPIGQRRGRSSPVRRERDARSLRDDLAPAGPFGERPVREPDVERLARRSSPIAAASERHLAHRRQAADPERERQAGTGQSRGQRRLVGRGQRSGEGLAGGHATRVDLLVGQRRIAVEVEVEACLEAWISAWSTTTSSRIRSGSTRTPRS